MLTINLSSSRLSDFEIFIQCNINCIAFWYLQLLLLSVKIHHDIVVHALIMIYYTVITFSGIGVLFSFTH